MAEPNERLRTLTATNNGFVIAQKDLEIRGAGEFFGTRQHGAPQMPALMLTGDGLMVARAREAYLEIMRDDRFAEERRYFLAAAKVQYDKGAQLFARN